MRGSFTFPIGSHGDRSTCRQSYQDRDLFPAVRRNVLRRTLQPALHGAGIQATPRTEPAREFVGDIFSVTNRLHPTSASTGNGSIKWTPLAWLNLTGEGGLDNSNAEHQHATSIPAKAPTTGRRVGAQRRTELFGHRHLQDRTRSQYTATVRAAEHAAAHDGPSIRRRPSAPSGSARPATSSSARATAWASARTTPTAASQRLASHDHDAECDVRLLPAGAAELQTTGCSSREAPARTSTAPSGRSVGNTVYPKCERVVRDQARSRGSRDARARSVAVARDDGTGRPPAEHHGGPRLPVSHSRIPLWWLGDRRPHHRSPSATPPCVLKSPPKWNRDSTAAMFKGRFNVEFTYFKEEAAATRSSRGRCRRRTAWAGRRR